MLPPWSGLFWSDMIWDWISELGVNNQPLLVLILVIILVIILFLLGLNNGKGKGEKGKT